MNRSFAILKLAVNPANKELVDLYKSHVEKHNKSILTDPFPNAGFDLLVPESKTIDIGSHTSTLISMDVRCEMTDTNGSSIAYYMYPRSSISKTPLMLANHTGIIDSGYRGFLMGAFRNLDLQPFLVEKHTRLLQICSSSLTPIHVNMVEEEELSTTSRGDGGFGSTGR